MTNQQRRCRVCDELKTVTDFYSYISSKTNAVAHRRTCKDCMNAQRQERLLKQKEVAHDCNEKVPSV